MKAPPRKRPGRRRPKRSPAEHIRNQHSLLILECDTTKLASDQLALGQGLDGLVRAAVPRAVVRLIQTNSEENLLGDLAEASAGGQNFRVIVIIGHSNQHGLRLTREKLLGWDRISTWLQPLHPRTLMLLACEAGGHDPSRHFFETIAGLNDIYGSPERMTRIQATALQMLVPHLVKQKRISTQTILGVQLAQLLATGGILFHHSRKEFKKPSGHTLLQRGLEFILRNKR